MKVIIANIAIFLLWLWIIAMILPIFRRKKPIIITSIIGAILGASVLWLSPQIIDGAFNTSRQLAQGVIWGIIISLMIISLIIQPKQRKQLLTVTTIIGTISVVGQIIITYTTGGHQSLVQFFFCIVLIEERIKYATAQHNTSKRSIHATDLIIFGIVAALSYARWENILIATNINTTVSRTSTYFVHVVFTTVFMGGVYLAHIRTKHRYTVGAIIAILLHLGYNITHGQIHRSIRIITIIIRYGVLTYLLSQTDSIYILRRDALAKPSPLH